ncbi:MAG: InlB B-repeat-containing protein [Faecalimonas sp.]|nr:InlB B-repeat-containing protein [Faecalimonas sp.]
MECRKRCRKMVAVFFAVCMVAANLSFVSGAADEKVTPSAEEYAAAFRTADVFMGSATSKNLKKGGAVYLTYTVEKVREDNESTQGGIIATDQPDLEFPYLEGGVLKASNNGQLLKEGHTYFFKFYYEEGEFQYVVGISDSSGEESKYIVFDSDTSVMASYPFTDDPNYVGVWFGGKLSARFTNIRCYDENGKDLGVYARKHRDSLLDNAKAMSKDTVVDHRYNLTVKEQNLVAISNKIPTQANTVYMEYTVKSCDTKVAQNGVANTGNAQAWWPWEAGSALIEGYDPMEAGYLLQTGASYIIRFERRDQFFMALVQRTYNGKTEFYEFTQGVGEFVADAPYFTLWIGEGTDANANFELVDFKCYDAEKNNLSVQANCVMDVVHFGELEDYSGCEAMYYSKESKSVIALYADQKAKVTRDGKTEEITYSVKEDTLTLRFADTEEVYEYYYNKFTDAEGRTYVRLGTYYLNFETGTEETIPQQQIDRTCGYVAQKPEAPKKEGADFMGWYLSDGTEYAFEEIVDHTITLYAKWSDDPEYQTVEAAAKTLSPMLIGIVASAIILAAGGAAGVIITRKRGGKSHGKTN